MGKAKDLNNQLEMAGRSRDYLELAELMAFDALQRLECCGSHYRCDLPFQRDDLRFAHVAAWEWSGHPSEPRLHREALEFEEIEPVERSY